LMSASTIVPSAIIVLVTVPESPVVTTEPVRIRKSDGSIGRWIGHGNCGFKTIVTTAFKH
jgi:hypothetical protein